MRKIRHVVYGGLTFLAYKFGGIPGAILGLIGLKTWHTICKDPEANKAEVIIDID